MIKRLSVLLSLFVACLSLCPGILADEADNGVKRTRNMSFNDAAVVEGVNRNPIDSADSLEKLDRTHRTHLYSKRQDFKTELSEHVQEAGYSQ